MAVGRFFHVAGDALLLTVDPKLANHQQIIAFSMLLRMDGELTRASIPSPGTIQLTLPKLLQLILRFGSLVVFASCNAATSILRVSNGANRTVGPGAFPVVLSPRQLNRREATTGLPVVFRTKI